MAKTETLLHLHCKCNSCTNWEVTYSVKGDKTTLHCVSCDTTVGLYDLGTPHAGLHWEKK